MGLLALLFPCVLLLKLLLLQHFDRQVGCEAHFQGVIVSHFLPWLAELREHPSKERLLRLYPHLLPHPKGVGSYFSIPLFVLRVLPLIYFPYHEGQPPVQSPVWQLPLPFRPRILKFLPLIKMEMNVNMPKVKKSKSTPNFS